MTTYALPFMQKISKILLAKNVFQNCPVVTRRHPNQQYPFVLLECNDEILRDNRWYSVMHINLIDAFRGGPEIFKRMNVIKNVMNHPIDLDPQWTMMSHQHNHQVHCENYGIIHVQMDFHVKGMQWHETNIQ